MELILHGKAINDLTFWRKTGSKIIQKKIKQLFNDMLLHPFQGLGKPEALKFDLTGQWSRRINREHRIIYQVEGEIIHVYSLKGHY